MLQNIDLSLILALALVILLLYLAFNNSKLLNFKKQVMKTLKFDGMEVEISDEDLQCDVFDISFGGHIKVQFTKQNDGKYIPTNAMNGWGDNCFQEIAGKEVVIE